MSNELLTKLMDPLEKGYNVDVSELIGSKGFGDQERKEELCTLAAKWYLDTSGGDRTTETEEIPTLDNLKIILADQNAHEIYVFKSDDWKNAIGALGTDSVPVACLFPDLADPYVWDSSVTVQNMVRNYFQKHAEDILAKIQEIQESRNEPVEQAPEIPEDLKKLRDPLDTDDINIFDLMPLPVYGATTVVTTDDFVIWFAKAMVRAQEGLSMRNLADRFYDRDQGVAGVFCNDITDTLKIIALFGTFPDRGRAMRSNEIARLTLESFWEINKDKIVSKVKEITKLWLEHGWL